MQIPVTINEIGAKGDGVGVCENKPVYVPKTAPGDVVEIAAKGERGVLQKIITPSPQRAEPHCPYFARCGGCALQHVTPEFYREWKIAKVKNALAREKVKVGMWNEPVFLPTATRRRTSFSVRKNGAGVTLGYNPVRSHEILDIAACLILEPKLDETMQALREFLPPLLTEAKSLDVTLQQADGLIEIILTGSLPQTKGRFSFAQDEAFGEIMRLPGIARLSWRKSDFAPIETILSALPFLKTFGAITVTLPPGAFLQASRAGEEALSAIVVEAAKGAGNIADLFSGCGTFTGRVLGMRASVDAFDGDKGAIEALARTKHPKLTALQRDLFKEPLTEMELSGYEAVLFDPPRAGAEAQAERLAWAGVPKLIGISCNPASFARDAAILQGGGYKLQSLTLVDQFVYSAHVEVAGIFTK